MVECFSTISGIAALNVALTSYLTSTLKIEKKILKQIISWICPLLISVFGFVFGLGLFAGYGVITSAAGWFYTVLTGFGIGLISNGIYDIEYVKNFIAAVKDFKETLKINK